MLNNFIVILKKIRKNGAYEWFLVRCSALLIFLYIIYLLYFIFNTHYLTYEIWCAFFSKKITKIFNLITLFSILIHSWIGISNILTDYIKNSLFKCIMIFIVIIIFFVYLLCGISLIWSV